MSRIAGTSAGGGWCGGGGGDTKGSTIKGQAESVFVVSQGWKKRSRLLIGKSCIARTNGSPELRQCALRMVDILQ